MEQIGGVAAKILFDGGVYFTKRLCSFSEIVKRTMSRLKI